MTAGPLVNSEPSPAALSPANNNFDAIRLLLAILVVFSHSFALSSGTEANEPLHRLSGKLTLGEIAVDGFFILSGFLIAHSFLRTPSVLQFLKKRVLRIYPGFIVVALLGVFVFGFAGADFRRSYFAALSLKELLIGLITLHAPLLSPVTHVPYGIAINGSLWSIPFEFGCYLLICGLGIVGLLRRRWAIMLIFLVAYFWYAWQVHYHFEYAANTWWGWLGGNGWPRLLTFFLSGTLYYVFQNNIPRNTSAIFTSVAALLAAILLSKGIHFVLPIFGSYLLFAAAFARKLPPLPFIRNADLSYGIYLYAFPLQQLIMKCFGKPISPLALFAIVLPPLFAAAMASWYGIERPFMRLRTPMKTVRPSMATELQMASSLAISGVDAAP